MRSSTPSCGRCRIVGLEKQNDADKIVFASLIILSSLIEYSGGAA
jgi:hypothetical protein